MIQLTTKQALINYLEFLKESGFLYAEGGVMDAVASMQPDAVAAPRPVAPTTGSNAAQPQTKQGETPRRPEATPAAQRAGTPQSGTARPIPPKGGTPELIPAKAGTPEQPPAAARVAIPAGPLSREDRLALLADGARRAEACRACPLGSQRTQAVYYDGDPMARIVFVGEAPGFNEDQQGKPFVGAAGQLLNRMIAAIGFKREEVFICNTLKCRPPQNRDPRPEEKAACEPFLIEQLQIVRPQILVALGAHAAQYLCRSEAPIGRLRERWHSYDGIPLLVTYHPSYLLKNEDKPLGIDLKRKCWADFQMLHSRYSELNPDDVRKIWTKKEKNG